MALSLYISEKFLEAQLYALAALNLIIQNSTSVTQKELSDAKSVFDKVKNVCLNTKEYTQLKTELDPKYNSSNSCTALVKIENSVVNFNFLEKKAIDCSIHEDLEKISTELMLKADRGLVHYLSNEEEISRAKKYAESYRTSGIVTIAAAGVGGHAAVSGGVATATNVAGPLFIAVGVGMIMVGLWSGNKLMNKGAKLLEEPKTREALNQIMKEALLAYDKRDFQKFFDVVSKEYKEGESIIKLKHRGDSIDNKVIVTKLIEHGFRPDGIAYLLILISEVLISGKIKIEESKDYETISQILTTDELKIQGNHVLNGVLDEKLVIEAVNLDQRVKNFREQSWISLKTYYWKLDNIMKDLYKNRDYSGLAKEYKHDAEEMPFVSRLEEMRNIAKINLTIIDILNNGTQQIQRAKNVIKEIHMSIKAHHQFTGKAEKRLEALEDLFWIVTGQSVPTNLELILA
jgi:hypothetical protein